MDRSFQGTYAPDLRTVTGSIIDGEDEPEYVCPSCCVHSSRLFLARVVSCVQLTGSFLPFFSRVRVCVPLVVALRRWLPARAGWQVRLQADCLDAASCPACETRIS